jgi:hypothetical protein
MADSKPIKYSQIAEANLFDPLKKEIEEVNKLLGVTEDNLKGVIKEANKIAQSTPLDSFENLQKVEKGIKDTTKAVEELDKVEKDRVRLQQRLAELDDERVQANFDLKEQIRLQTKEMRDNARAAANAGNAYEQLKKQTNEAQAEAKKLAAEFGVNSKQAREAIKQFERFDNQLREVNETMRDGRRDVGRYEQGTKRLTTAFKAFATATIVLKVFELLGSSIQNNSEGAAELEKRIARLTTFIEVFARRFVIALPIIGAKFDQFALRVEIAIAKITSLLGGNGKSVEELEKQYDELSKTADQDLTAIFANMGAEIDDLTKKKIDLIDGTLKYRKEIIALEKEVAGLIESQEALRAGFEDDSQSLEEQIENGVAFRKELEARFTLERQIARDRLRIAELNAAANGVSIEAQEQLSQALIEYNQLVADQASELRSTEKEIQKLRDDATQLNLDFYIDDFDNRKTVNERIIADETQTFARRRELLAENQRFTEEVFRAEADALNDSLAQRGKYQLDFARMVQNTAEENAKIVRESGISEQLAIRVLEVIRERRTFLQDNAEAQRDLNAAEEASRLIGNDIIAQREALNALDEEGADLQAILNSLAETRLQNEIDELRIRLVLAREGSAAFLAINQELNEKLLQQNQNRINKEREQEVKRIQELKEGVELVADLFDARAERRIEAIDKEVAAEQTRANALRELAAQGNEDAENNLALIEQRQAELELQRQQQLQRQERRELALSAIQTYSGKVQAGDSNPLASTISDISVLRAFINTLPAFYEGTEDTGKVSNPLDRHGGRLAVIHDNERILTAEQNSLIGQMSNKELVATVNRSKKQSHDFEPLVNEIKTLTRITRDKPTYLGSDYDKLADAVITKMKKGTTLERTHRKNGGIWGQA